MAVENITLNLIPTGDTPSIHVAQFDVDRPFNVTLKEGADDFTPTDYTIELQVRKVDATIVTVLPTQTSGNVVTFNTTEQMTACSGTNIAELQLTKDSQTFATLHFYLVVQRDVLAGGVTSESDIYNLTEQIAEIVPEVIGDDYYNKEEVDEKLSEIPTFDPNNYYDKSDVNTLLNDKADVSDLPDMTDYYTKSEVDTKITDLYQIKTVSGDIVNITDGGDDIPVISFECEIGSTGYSQAEITVCGKNLLSGLESGTYGSAGNPVVNVSRCRSTNTFINVLPLTNYYVSGSISGKTLQVSVNFHATNVGGNERISNSGWLNVPTSFSTPAGCYFINLVFRSSDDANINVTDIVNSMLEIGDTVSTYEEYIGTIYTVEFGSTFNDGALKYENGAWYIDESGTITPISSSTRIKTISGENNIFSNTGDCGVSYFTEKSDGIAELIKAFM